MVEITGGAVTDNNNGLEVSEIMREGLVDGLKEAEGLIIITGEPEDGLKVIGTAEGSLVGVTFNGLIVGDRDGPEGLVVGAADGFKVHVNALGEFKKISVGEVIKFPIQ